MTNKISLGQYFPCNSILHKLDPRTKILLTIFQMIFVFLINSYFSLALVGILVSLMIVSSGVSLKLYFKNLKIVMFIAIFTSLLNLFYGSGEVVFSLFFLKIRDDGIKNSVFVAFRIIFLMLTSSCLTFTTLPNDLSDGIERLMKPLSAIKIPVHEMAMMMTITIRFVPTLLEESGKIMMAQKARGASFDSKKIKDKLKSFAPILILLLIASLRRAYELALAMDSRCYSGSKNRTRMRQLKFKSLDIICCLFFICYVSMTLLLNISKKNG